MGSPTQERLDAISGRRRKDVGQAKTTVAHYRAQHIARYTIGT